MFEFKLPDLGEGIAEGEILKWYVGEGDTVAEDAPLVDVETDKAAVTIPSPRGGRIATLNGKVGDTINVGDVITVIDDGSGEVVTAPETATAAAEAAIAAATAAATEAATEATRPTAAEQEAPSLPTEQEPAAADLSRPATPPGERDRRPVPAAPATRSGRRSGDHRRRPRHGQGRP